MVGALKALGVELEERWEQCEMVVHGCGGRFPAQGGELFLGNAGTAMRCSCLAPPSCQHLWIQFCGPPWHITDRGRVFCGLVLQPLPSPSVRCYLPRHPLEVGILLHISTQGTSAHTHRPCLSAARLGAAHES